MLPRLSFIVLSKGQDLDQTLESSSHIELRARLERVTDLEEAVNRQRPDAILVALEGDPRVTFAALEKLPAPRPLLFFYGPDDSRLILQAMRCGACEYVTPGSDEREQLIAAVERLARDRGGSAEAHRSALVAVMGAKGGVGASFVACQLSASLARMGERVALADGHLRLGDVAVYMNLSPQYTFASLASRSEAIDSTYLRTTLEAHSSGVQVLATPTRPEEADAVGVGCVERVVGLLRSEFDWVIWDTPREFDDRSVLILDRADPILVVTTPDVASMHHARMQLDLLERLGRSPSDIRIVANRTERAASVSSREAREFLGRPADASIPNDFSRATACVNEGRTLYEVGRRSPLGRAMSELAVLTHSWCGRRLPHARTRSRRGLVSRLRRRSDGAV
jgi:pilus assembly protein CpaE